MDEIYSKKHKLPKALEQELQKGLRKPSWESRNEGVHEKVNFDDTIWGFELAGGAYYNTPLRITTVCKNSRAERVGIKPGDLLIGINGMETSCLTVQEAHDLILQSVLQIKLTVTASDVEETTYYVWEDELEDESPETQHERETEIQQQEKIFKGAKTNELWSNIWPCKNKRDIFYRESNCFMVPSRYEERHPDKILKKAEVKKAYCGKMVQ